MYVKFKKDKRCSCGFIHRDNSTLSFVGFQEGGWLVFNCKKEHTLAVREENINFLDRFLSTNEIKKIMQISKQGLDFLRNKDILVMIKQDGRWKMDIDEFKKFVETRRGVVDARYKFTI